MGNKQSSAARSSRSSHRYSPDTHPPAPTSGRPSPLPSEPHIPDAESHSSQHALSSAVDDLHLVTLNSADDHLPPPSAYYPAATTPTIRQPPIPPLPYSQAIHAVPASHLSTHDVPPAFIYSHSSTSNALLHPTSSSMTEYPPAPLLLDSQANYTAQPSTSTRQLEPSSYQLSQWLQPVLLSQLPFPHAQPVATNTAYSGSTISLPVDSLPGSQSLHVVQPSISVNGPEDSTHQNYSVQQRPPQGQLSTRPGETYYGEGMFSNASNFSLPNSTFIDNSTTLDSFMKECLQHTIMGAEFDSSDRHPPPRCHPKTRLKIIERCKVFIVQCEGEEKMRWVIGPAGVGKSAIMQMVAEETPADASVFLSVNGRQDGSKLFTTIAYQLAVKYKPYRQFIQKELSNDPTLLRKALLVQFQKFVVDPFIHRNLFDASRRYLVIIDGLDECDNRITQQEILGLISHFCLSYPTSPIVWIIASRPEPHITAFFDDSKVAPAYTKEEILIDSDEACEDVQRYLRDELNNIKNTYPTLRRKREWPSELEFTKIATAAGGLFAYASTVVRYIGDPYYQDPAGQLCRVLRVIDASPGDDVSEKDHPMAHLDALYKRILSNIPPGAMINARKLLLAYGSGLSRENFRFRCNMLGLSEDAAYGVVRHLHAVAKVPTPDQADDEDLRFFHKSFSDFLCDYDRSGFSPNLEDDVGQLVSQCSFRIVRQVPDTFDGTVSGRGVHYRYFGHVKDGPGFCDNVLLSWPGDERYSLTDDQLKLELYLNTVGNMCFSDDRYQTMSWFRVLTTRFIDPGELFPFYELRDSAFELLRAELTELGKLRQVPLRALDYAAICGGIDLRFTSPIGTDVKLTDPWDPSCEHEKQQLDDLPQRRGWSTPFQRSLDDHGDGDGAAQMSSFPRFHIKAGEHYHWEFLLKHHNPDKYIHYHNPDKCIYCPRRFARHFIDNPDQLATIFTDSTQMTYVEVSFQDPDDGVSEWRYRFFHSGSPSCIN